MFFSSNNLLILFLNDDGFSIRVFGHLNQYKAYNKLIVRKHRHEIVLACREDVFNCSLFGDQAQNKNPLSNTLKAFQQIHLSVS